MYCEAKKNTLLLTTLIPSCFYIGKTKNIFTLHVTGLAFHTIPPIEKVIDNWGNQISAFINEIKIL